jgi:hypothetical protein
MLRMTRSARNCFGGIPRVPHRFVESEQAKDGLRVEFSGWTLKKEYGL